MTELRFYWEARDWAGLGFLHRMIAWVDANGTPRSIVIRA